MSQRYVIDVTQLVHWPGNLTGIPRVMNELSVRFLKAAEDNDVVFVSWVKECNQMCEVDFASTQSHRGNGIDYLLKKSNRLSEQNITTRQATVSIPIKYLIKKIAAKSQLDHTKIYKKAQAAKWHQKIDSYKHYTPQEGDLFFIPWGEWWDQNWLSILKQYQHSGVKLYPVCHDILPMIVPQFSGNSASLENFVTQIFPLSSTILAVSKSSKDDLIGWMSKYSLHIPPIKVFRLGEDFTAKKTRLSTDKMEKKYHIAQGKYLIYVSTIEPRKNHLLLYYTYKLALSRNVQLPHLVIVGRVGHDMKEILHMMREDPQTKDSISIENNVDDSDLNWLYQNSMFAITSSFYEGWGMSVLESIMRGKPVVCSNTSSLLEMPKDCVIHFNPASTDECLAAIERMAHPDTLKRYTKNARAYIPHTWDDSFKQVIDIMETNE